MEQKGMTIMISCKKLELILAFSIVDAISVQKDTTIMTSFKNGNKKVRQMSRKPGKISGKNPGSIEKQPGKPVGQVIPSTISNTTEKSQKAKFQQEIYDQENYSHRSLQT